MNCHCSASWNEPLDPSPCHCGTYVDVWGFHAFICRRAMGKTQRYHAINDVIAQAFASAGVPVSKKPSGRSRGVKGPDGVMLIPWQAEKPLQVYIGCDSCITTRQHVHQLDCRFSRCSCGDGGVEKDRKINQLAGHLFVPALALGLINSYASACLKELSRSNQWRLHSPVRKRMSCFWFNGCYLLYSITLIVSRQVEQTHIY